MFVRAFRAFALVLVAAIAALPLRGAVDDSMFDDRFGFTGIGIGQVKSIAVAPNGDIYAAGPFKEAGGIHVRGVARWDGRRWHPLGTGLGTQFSADYINAIVIRGDDVYVAGTFTGAGNTAAKHIARWNIASQQWSVVGNGQGPNGDIRALAFTANGDLYAGGTFTAFDGVAAKGIARFSGGAWSEPGGGLTAGSAYVEALTAVGNTLYVGGTFRRAGTVDANSIVRWDGANWQAIGTGVTSDFDSAGIVYSIVVDGTSVYAGGYFNFAGGAPANSVARWNGTSWSALAGGTTYLNTIGRVYGLAMFNGALHAAGSWDRIGGIETRSLARWNGTAWEPLGTANDNGLYDVNGVFAMTAGPGALYIGGDFSRAAGDRWVNRITAWTGTEFLAFGKGVNISILGTVRSIDSAANGDIYIGGQFSHAGGKVVNNVARWNGSDWIPLGGGVNGIVSAVVVDGDNVYVGGDFSQAGTVATPNIARWHIPTQTWFSLGTGLNSSVSRMVIHGGNLLVGGAFNAAGADTSIARLARWTGAAWAKISANQPFVGGQINAMLSAGGALWVGGNFLTVVPAGGTSMTVNSLIRFDGTNWSTVGPPGNPGVTGGSASVNALAMIGDRLYIGGDFTTTAAGPSADIVSFTIAGGFQPLGQGTGGTVPQISSLEAVGNDLYAGGQFNTINGTAVNHFALYSGGAWTPVGSGIGPAENLSLTILDIENGPGGLFFGGTFVTAGAKPSASIGRIGSAVAGKVRIKGTITTAGRANHAGVTVTLTGGAAATTTTDAAGAFEFQNLDAGASYTVTPSLAGYSFTPPSLSFTNVTADITTASFAGAPSTTGGGCTPQPFSCGASASGTLQAGDCQVSARSNEAWVDVYEFNGTAGQSVTLTLQSGAFDAFLLLIAPDGTKAAENDDDGGSRNSHITHTLTATGTWKVQVTSYSPGESGAYTLASECSGTNPNPSLLYSLYTLPPCRVHDTRGSSGPKVGGNSQRDFAMTGRCGIPADAKAVSVNITVTDNAFGYLTIWPKGAPRPEASTINYQAGFWALANAATIPLGQDGAISIFAAGDPTHIIIDVNGYFK